MAMAGLLSACGGGEGETIAESSHVAARQAAAIVAPLSSADTTVEVKLAELPNNNGNWVIVKSRWTGEMVSLDDLPKKLAEHRWFSSENSSGNLRVRFKPGVYRLTKGWTWPAQLSGKDANRQVIMETAGSGVVEILGSKQFSQTYRASNPTMMLDVGTRQFEQLWAAAPDDSQFTRAIRARTPNAGSYFWIKGPAQGWPAGAGNTTVVKTLNGSEVSKQAFQADLSSFDTLAQIVQQQDTGAVLQLMNSWQVSRHRIAEVDQLGKRVRIEPATLWSIAEHGHGQRYFIENTLSALDAPGEWYLSKGSKNTLHYIPPSAVKDGSTVRFEVPVVERLLTMQGAANQNQWVQFVQFSGLKFKYARGGHASPHSEGIASGYLDPQADTYVNAAIELNDARNIAFVNCEVSRTGGYGIWMRERVRNVAVESSELYDLGAGGMKIGKARPSSHDATDLTDAQDPASTGAISVRGNRIHSTGHVYPGAVGVWIGRSSNNTVEDNLIQDTTYTAISVGWNWDSGTSMAQNNKVRNNFIYNIGQRTLSDMGGIYLLGRAPDTEVSGNVIKEVRSYDGYTGGSNGIYADEGSSELVVSGNIVVGTNTNGFSLHYGNTNWVEGNVFADTRHAFSIGKRDRIGDTVSTDRPATIARNAFLPHSNDMVGLSNDETLMARPHEEAPFWLDTKPLISGNRVSAQYLPAGSSLQIPSLLCAGCSADASLTLTDLGPLHVPQVTGKDLREGVNVARSWNTAPLNSVPSASRLWSTALSAVPPRTLDFQAAQWPVPSDSVPVWQLIADPTKLLNQQDNTKPLTVRAASDGTPVLALADAPRISERAYEPYIQTWMRHSSGYTTLTMQVRFDGATNLTNEWRADDRGTTTGPQVSFVSENGVVNVKVRGQTLTSVPVGVWVTIAIGAEIREGGTWNLWVQPQSGRGAYFTNLQPQHPNWSYLGPVLFISHSNVHSATEFKSVAIENTP